LFGDSRLISISKNELPENNSEGKTKFGELVPVRRRPHENEFVVSLAAVSVVAF
jgi:hypothetical protein